MIAVIVFVGGFTFFAAHGIPQTGLWAPASYSRTVIKSPPTGPVRAGNRDACPAAYSVIDNADPKRAGLSLPPDAKVCGIDSNIHDSGLYEIEARDHAK
jgi:hypothetical protein